MKFGMNTLIYTGKFTDDHARLMPGLKAAGFDGVEISPENKGDFDTGKMRDAVLAAGLECSSICGQYGPGRDMRGPDPDGIRGGIQYTKDLMDVAVEMGTNLVVGPMYSAVGRANLEEEEDRKSQWKTAVESFKEVCEYAEKKDVYLAVEPLNRFETDFINIADQALQMVHDVGSKRLGLHLDTFHMSVEEKDSAAALRKAGDRLFHVHACENDRGAPGTGQIRWDRIAEALKDINYDRWVVIESFTPEVKMIARAAAIWRPTEKDADTLAAKGVRFLRELLA
jgi:D-psicose/D-tagatose/L-ribulose 3-epimerase